MKSIKSILGILALVLMNTFGYAQTEGVSIKTNASAPHASAMLDIESGSKGILIPRVELTSLSSTSSPVASPTTGLLVFNTGTGVVGGTGFYYWNGIKWTKIATGNGADLWTTITATSQVVPAGTNSNSISRQAEVVLVGDPSTAVSGASLAILGPALFAAGGSSTDAVPSWTGQGIHVGEPWDVSSGGHWNEINTPNYYLDLQFNTGQNINIGQLGGSDLTVLSGSINGGANGGGNIYADGDIVCLSLTQTSDSVLKKNISAYSNVLSKINNCGTYEYRFKHEANNSQKHIGIMAQEIEAQFPQLVRQREKRTPKGPKKLIGQEYDTKTYKTVDYSGLTSVLLQAIKEQQAEIQLLKTKVQTLEQR